MNTMNASTQKKKLPNKLVVGKFTFTKKQPKGKIETGITVKPKQYKKKLVKKTDR